MMKRFLQSLFLFSPANDYVPQLLRRTALMGMVGMVLLSFLAANLQALLWQSSAWLVSNILPAVIVEQTNAERSDLAAPVLRRSAVLDTAAQKKAEHMVAGNYFAHFSPEGVSPWHWFDEVGYVYAHAGENLAIHFNDSSEVVDAWMRSPTHRANIVNDNYTEIGVGTARGTYEGFDTVFVVQLFGTPAEPVVWTEVAEDTALVFEPQAVLPASATSATTAALVAGEATLADTLVTTTASATAIALSYESTPRLATDEVNAVLPPPLTYEAHAVTDDGVSFYTGIVATSSGLAPSLASTESAGATKTAFAARVATEPNTILSAIYIALSIVIGGMLVLALTLAVRSHRWQQIAHSVALLILMAGLITVHLFLTAGAVVV